MSNTNAKIKAKPILITLTNYLDKKDNNTKNKRLFLYVNDIKYTLKYYNLNTNGKKNELVNRLDNFYKTLSKYNNDINKIITIQKHFRNNKKNRINKFLGPGFMNKSRCINEEDFYTFENINNIEDLYFFSYKDTRGNIYFFDIRSFKKLLENKGTNPYNREPIPKYAISNMYARFEFLKDNNIMIEEFEEPILTPEQKFNNKVTNLFQKIDELNITAGGTYPGWFHDLSFIQLKHLYKVLEDIWNYRAELDETKKKFIVPNGNMFPILPSKIDKFHSTLKRKLQNIILEEMNKLVSSSENLEHRTTGGYYILISLVEISIDVANSLPWLIQI